MMISHMKLLERGAEREKGGHVRNVELAAFHHSDLDKTIRHSPTMHFPSTYMKQEKHKLVQWSGSPFSQARICSKF